MNAGQLAELIAAGFWAVLVCVVVFVLFRLARLISAGSRMLTEQHERTGLLLDAAQAAVDRTTGQLDRTEAITASLDQVTAEMAGLSGHVSALAGMAKGISAGLGTPLLRFAAAVYGLRRAVALRRPERTALPVPRQGIAGSRPAVGSTVSAVSTVRPSQDLGGQR